jgi:hypothetical protein
MFTPNIFPNLLSASFIVISTSLFFFRRKSGSIWKGGRFISEIVCLALPCPWCNSAGSLGNSSRSGRAVEEIAGYIDRLASIKDRLPIQLSVN